jgi:hypothetical protein
MSWNQCRIIVGGSQAIMAENYFDLMQSASKFGHSLH